MSEARDKNGNVVVTRSSSVIASGKEIVHGCQMVVKSDIRDKIK